MARKTTPPAPQPANLSHPQMREAIPKIDRRLAELASFDPDSVTDLDDPRITSLQQKLEALFESIYAPGTAEHQRDFHAATTLYAGSFFMGGIPLNEMRKGLWRGKQTVQATLETIKARFEEELSDAGLGGTAKALRAYEGLELHASIERAAGQLYRDGHYANAIEDAVKALNALVRLNSGVDDKDGASLMDFVFNSTKPVLKFNPLADQSDRDEQRGFMMMFSGAVAGLRNPRAHRLIKDDPERALEFIAYISLLAKLADAATK